MSLFCNPDTTIQDLELPPSGRHSEAPISYGISSRIGLFPAALIDVVGGLDCELLDTAPHERVSRLERRLNVGATSGTGLQRSKDEAAPGFDYRTGRTRP